MKKEYASSEERAVDRLYQKLGKMTLIMDKDGKPKKWVTIYPPMKDLIAECGRQNIELPKTPKLHDVLLVMVKAGYNNIQHYPPPDQAIKSLDDRAFEKGQADLGYPVAPGAEKSQPGDEQQVKIYKKEAEDAKLEAQRARVEAEQSKAEADHAKLEAEEAKLETEQYKIIVEQTKVEGKLVELQVEIDELEVHPEQDKAKIDKKQAEKSKLEAQLEKLLSDFDNLKATPQKKKISNNKEDKK